MESRKKDKEMEKEGKGGLKIWLLLKAAEWSFSINQ
jgi:hypothetical protein